VHTLTTRLTARYGVRLPIASAGLAFVGMSPSLPIAVARAGGIGAFGVGPLPANAIAPALEAIRAGTTAPININFITIFVTEAHIAACEALRPEIVSFHWGHPSPDWIARLHAVGCDVWEQVGTVDAARTAQHDGIDLVVVQGSESGGHNFGALPLAMLLPEVRRALGPEMLLLAAGGIVDGAGLVSALAQGADGVWIGTRLVATDEADAPAEYKARLVAANSDQTRLTSLYGRDCPVLFNPMRVLENEIVKEWADRETEAPVDIDAQPPVGTMEMFGETIPIRRFSSVVPMATATGDFEQMALLSGQGVGGVRDVLPTAIVLERMIGEAVAIIRDLGARVSA
jgi:NAD(P)H-dependent flavin oxidoreductase YrpB (nitropropane dioxygenase family)